MTGFRPRSLSEYAGLLWRKKLFIVLTAAVVLLATGLVIKRIPDFYESRAMVVVVAGNPSEDGRQEIATEISLITKQLESRPTLETIIKRNNLYPGMSRDGQIGQMLKALKLETRLRGYYPEVPEAVAISFRHADPALAQRVLNDVVTFFVGTNDMATRQAAEEVRTIEAKVAEVEEQLRRQGARQGVRFSFDPRAARAERQAATATVESLKDKQYVLERQNADQQRENAEQQKLVKVSPPTKQSGAQGALLVRKAELEGQLKDYATQYTDKNPKVVATRNQLTEINRQLAQLNVSGGGDGEVALAGTPEGRELRSMQRDLSRLQTEMEVTQRELNRRTASLESSPAAGPAVATASSDGEGTGAAETAYLQNRYISLLDRKDRLQMALAAPNERGLAHFRVVDPPNLPLSPFGPDRTKLKLMALAGALAFGLFLAAASEGARLRLIQNERDAEYYLGAPVVGLIPQTFTPDERGHRRRLLLARRFILLALGVAAIPILAVVIYRLDIIQRIAFR
jgi:uncharacterized protein involved in exopolysaccharide biosynthesis